MKHVSLRVKGKVQGVFYRASAATKAQQLGVKGFVRNEPDGSVYIEAEGEETSLEKFITWCKSGPTRAVVENVEVSEMPPKQFQAFEIKS